MKELIQYGERARHSSYGVHLVMRVFRVQFAKRFANCLKMRESRQFAKQVENPQPFAKKLLI